MLIGIDPILGPDCLCVLRAMGHGDTVVLADANFPADSVAERLVRIDGASLAEVLRAVLAILPVDEFEPQPLVGMQVVDDPDATPPVVAEAQAVVDAMVPGSPRIEVVERFAFYDRARDAYAVIATGERAFYGNLIIRKGVVAPPANG
jgi:L-fucose mutarotase